MMQTILEIIKYTLPGLIVFAAVYYILRQYLSSQYELKRLEIKSNYTHQAIPIKLQAYERLLLFCDRISIPSLLLRLKSKEMNADQLKTAMIISVQKEYEHNMAQQLYTSHKLWEILTLVKNDIISIISDAGSSVGPQASSQDLSAALMNQLRTQKKSPEHVGIQAIKEEAKIILDV